MEKQKHTVRLMLNIGLILQILRTVLEIAVYMFPKQALQLMNYNYPEGIAKALETKPDLSVRCCCCISFCGSRQSRQREPVPC